jgi:hypothetical protein
MMLLFHQLGENLTIMDHGLSHFFRGRAPVPMSSDDFAGLTVVVRQPRILRRDIFKAFNDVFRRDSPESA